ncbi:MAG: DNA repair exonuclease [Actinobacteria bacterium]|nr:DNA repair exonuclease [Actinomycetota bacterium]
MTQHEDGRIGTMVHAADLHLGAPLQSLGNQVSEDVAEQIRDRAARALDDLIDLVLAEEAEILVLAGDIYDEAEYDVGAQLRFVKGLRRLTSAGVRVFLAHGNHDPLVSTFQPAASLPDAVVVFNADEVQSHTVELSSGHEVTVAGISFGKKSETDNLALRFHDQPFDLRRTVGVLHANVGSNAQHGPYAPCTVDDLDQSPVGYWALGHIHKRQAHELGPGRWWAYPGNLQGRSTKATECGPKGALVVPIMPDGFGEPEFKMCDRVRFERVDVDVTERADLDGAFDAAVEVLEAYKFEAADRPVVARIEFVGSTPAHHQLANQEDLLDLLRERVGVDQISNVIAKVVVSTRPAVSREQILERQNLQSALLQRVDGLRGEDCGLDELLGDFDSAARKRLEKLLLEDPGLIESILDRAEQLLVDGLEEAS